MAYTVFPQTLQHLKLLITERCMLKTCWMGGRDLKEIMQPNRLIIIIITNSLKKIPFKTAQHLLFLLSKCSYLLILHLFSQYEQQCPGQQSASKNVWMPYSYIDLRFVSLCANIFPSPWLNNCSCLKKLIQALYVILVDAMKLYLFGVQVHLWCMPSLISLPKLPYVSLYIIKAKGNLMYCNGRN